MVKCAGADRLEPAWLYATHTYAPLSDSDADDIDSEPFEWICVEDELRTVTPFFSHPSSLFVKFFEI